jgi:hypothetical protein
MRAEFRAAPCAAGRQMAQRYYLILWPRRQGGGPNLATGTHAFGKQENVIGNCVFLENISLVGHGHGHGHGPARDSKADLGSRNFFYSSKGFAESASLAALLLQARCHADEAPKVCRDQLPLCMAGRNQCGCQVLTSVRPLPR